MVMEDGQEQQEQPTQAGLVVMLVGFDEATEAVLRSGLEPIARQVRTISDVLPVAVQRTNFKATVAMEQKMLYTSHIVVANMNEDVAEVAMQVQYAVDLQRPVVVVGENADAVGWVAQNTLATFPDVAGALVFLQSYLAERTQ